MFIRTLVATGPVLMVIACLLKFLVYVVFNFCAVTAFRFGNYSLRVVTEVSPSVSGVPGELEILQSST